MALTVVIRSGELKAPAAITFDAPRVVVGRGEGCEVRLPDPSVSQRHASIRQRGTDYVLVDEGSTNGTFVGPVRLSPQAPRVIRSGDLVRVGRIWLELRVEQALVTQNAQDSTREIALALVASALASQGEQAAARVRVENGPDQGKELLLTDFEQVYALGRAPNADLMLSDGDSSRRHVEVFRRGQHVCIRDLGSKNGSTLGDVRLEPNRDTPWTSGSLLKFGANEFSLSDPVLQALSELETLSDERMRPDDALDPPGPTTDAISRGAPGSDAPKEPRSGSAPVAPSPAAGAPIAQVPKGRAERPDPHKGGGFRTADAIIALVALAVLGLSLLGLFWLLRQ